MHGEAPLACAGVPAATLAAADDAAAEPAPPPSRRRVAWIEHAVVSVLTIATAWPFLRRHSFVTGFDTVAYSGPNLRLTLDAWRHGRLALWNDLIFGGVTHVGNPAAGALYPLKALALPFGVSRGLSVLVIVHLLILANGMVALLSWRLRLRPPAATVGAVVLVGSGLVVMKVLQFEQLLVLAWIPLLVALVHWVLTARRPYGPMIATAVVTTLTLIAGHPQTVYMAAPFVVVVAIAFAADAGVWRRLPYVAAAAVLGLLLAAPQLLPEVNATSEGALTGARPLSVVENPVYRLDAGRTVRALLGNPLTDFPDADAGTYEAMSFVGAAAATLAVLGAVDGVRRRRRRVLTAVLLGCLVAGVIAAWGPRTWFYRVAYEHLPLFAQARVPARWLTVTVLAIAVLAGLGANAIAGRRVDRLSLGVVGAAAAVVGLLVVTQVMSTPGWRVVAIWIVAAAAVAVAALLPSPRRRDLAFAVAVLPLAVVVIDLGAASRHAIASRDSSAQSVEDYGGAIVSFLDGRPGRSVALTFDELGNPPYLVASLRPNANALSDIPSLDGYDGGVQVTDRWAQAMSVFASGPYDPELTLRAQMATPVDTGSLGRYGVRWVVIDTRAGDPSTLVPGFRGPVAQDGTLAVYENPAWLGDAVAWFTTQPAADPAEAARLLGSGGVAPDAAVTTDGSAALTCRRPCDPTGLTVDRPRPERADLHVDLAADALVALHEQADRGWTVSVDGHSADTVLVDGFYVGVRVPAGTHDVRFTYVPRGFRLGLVLAVGAALVLIGLAAAAAQGRRDVARSTAGPSALSRKRSPVDE